MKILIKTKLLEGKYIELRSYELGKTDLKVIHCTNEDYKSCFHVKEPYMVLTLAKQKEGKIVNTQRSKFYPYSYYKMVSFLWKPKAEIQDKQIEGKEIEFIGNIAYIKD